MKAPCVICCGLIQMIEVAGAYHHVELDIPLGRYDTVTCYLLLVTCCYSRCVKCVEFPANQVTKELDIPLGRYDTRVMCSPQHHSMWCYTSQ